jgi:hypothetical protein
MKYTILIFTFLVTILGYSQCNQYYIYESFNSSLPTQGGTWVNTSVPYGTTPVKSGTHNLTFNAINDAIRTPLIVNPGVLTFWYRRSTNTTAWTLNVQTSTNGTSWTTRGSVSSATTSYQQYTLNLGALGLTNIYIRLIDSRTSGGQERYVDDIGVTSTNNTENVLIPFLGDCSQTLNSLYTYTITDDGGPVSSYSNNIDRTITLTPSDNTKKIRLSFTQFSLETDYDYLSVYDGSSTSSTLLATLNGSSIPTTIIAKNPTGQLTLRWTTDISNIGTWGGFTGQVISVTVPPNDNPINATELTVTRTESFTTYTNQYSSATTTETTPSCALYTGEDVWFKITVPFGISALEFNTQTGNITDAGMSIYRGTIGSLTEIECDDDDSPNGNMSFISRTDFNEFETIYIRIWEYNGGTVGTFGITVTTPQPLPIVLSYLDVIGYGNYNLVRWETESENNSDYFKIQRSNNGSDWYDIGTQKANGFSNEKISYTHIDKYVSDKIIYYRLLQFDYDGEYYTYGPVYVNGVNNKKIVYYVNLLGQPVDKNTNGVVFEVFDDGTTRKIINH